MAPPDDDVDDFSSHRNETSTGTTTYNPEHSEVMLEIYLSK